MNLPEETRELLYHVYGDLSEELYIFFRTLRNEGFTSEDAMRILCAIIGRPDNFVGDYKRRRTKPESMGMLRDYIKQQKKEKETGNDDT